MILVLGAVTALAVVPLLWGRPIGILVTWLVSLGAVPYWVSVPLGFDAPVAYLATLGLCAIALLSLGPPPLETADRLVGLFALSLLVVPLVSDTAFSAAVVLLVQVAAAYTLGRVLARHASVPTASACVAGFGAVVAVLALVEFAFGWHPFVGFDLESPSAPVWAQIQLRGDLARSEWTFGHSIALGNVLAICIPFVWSTRWRTSVRLALTLLLLGGIVVTFSRNAVLAGILAALLSVLVGPGNVAASLRRTSVATKGLVVLAGTAMASALLYISQLGGSETALSTTSRLNQLDLLPAIEVLGRSASYFVTSKGLSGFALAAGDNGVTDTVDNALLSIALQTGWIPAVLLLLVVALTAARQLRALTRSSAGLAVVAQLVTIATVALITQYAVLLWFVVGVAISWRTPSPGGPTSHHRREPVSAARAG